MRNPLNQSTTKLAICLGLSLAGSGLAAAQATETAQRGAQISTFATTTYVNPDYGPTHNIGYTFGVDYDRIIHYALLQPSLEVRMTNSHGDTASERSFLGGFKLTSSIYGIHPYGTMFAGTGVITFSHPVIQGYLTDSSFVYSLGGGAEFPVRTNFMLRADFTQQHWNLNPTLLQPVTLGLGISYRLPLFNHPTR